MNILTLDFLSEGLSPIRLFDGFLKKKRFGDGDKLIDEGQDELSEGDVEEGEADLLEGLAKKLRERAQDNTQ